jgi:DNA (cytosine-5)-methyltransferase 1
MQQVYQTTIFDFYHQPILNKYETTTIFEAFSGIGTFSMALKRLGYPYEIIGFSEVDRHAVTSYQAIHGENLLNYGDISKIKEIPTCDICTWGFPCQDVSNAGLRKGMVEGTRSNYGYEFLKVLSQTPNKPKVLIMENVMGLINKKFINDFKRIKKILNNLGYENHFKVLNALEYDVPQNRKRIFMVSILNGGFYEFPKKLMSSRVLEDFLESDVDEKYFLSKKQLDQIISWNAQQDPLKNAKYRTDKYIQTITAKSNTSMNASMILIKEKTLKGYKAAYHGDGIYIDRPFKKRGVVKHQAIPTLKTSGFDIGVVLIDDELARIRRLTPLEAWRLMGIDDDDFYKAQAVVSNTRLYKQAGNAVVVDVLVELFRNLY